MHRQTRVKDQPHKLALGLMDEEDMINFIAQEWVDKIKALQLPGLVFHADHNQYLETLIRMQLSELYFATSYQCNTERVGERLVQLPSQRVRDAIAIPTCNSYETFPTMEFVLR